MSARDVIPGRCLQAICINQLYSKANDARVPFLLNVIFSGKLECICFFYNVCCEVQTVTLLIECAMKTFPFEKRNMQMLCTQLIPGDTSLGVVFHGGAVPS